MDWCCVILSDFPGEEAALLEVKLLRRYLSGLAVAKMTIKWTAHYDFETDNVYFDKLTKGHVIDFDDAMYHWFAMDIDQALDSLWTIWNRKTVIRQKYASSAAIARNGRYLMKCSAKLPVFRRFAKLYSYTRIRRSMSETWNNEPD